MDDFKEPKPKAKPSKYEEQLMDVFKDMYPPDPEEEKIQSVPHLDLSMIAGS